jgi:hypothetical protein
MQITSTSPTNNTAQTSKLTEPKSEPAAEALKNSPEEIAKESRKVQQPATPMGASGTPKVDILV